MDEDTEDEDGHSSLITQNQGHPNAPNSLTQYAVVSFNFSLTASDSDACRIDWISSGVKAGLRFFDCVGEGIPFVDMFG